MRATTGAGVARQLTESNRMWDRAKRVIPTGTQTLSKAPNQFVDGVSPKFLQRGHGCHVWDVDGNEYIDYPMALGPILLGYGNAAVTEAAIAQVREGTVFTLMHPIEVEVAEMLTDIIPCAEQVRFAKNGADATSGAIRAARLLTGRESVIATGYHGYHDWYIASTDRNGGIPEINRRLIDTLPFNDIDALDAKLRELDGRVAAVIMEVPAHEPEPGYLQGAIDTAHRHGAVFILDEIVTGFRYAIGGAQEYYGIVPDLACFGKGMANGFPLAAVVGKADAMSAFDEIFFSTTYGGETVSLAAAQATITVLQTEPVLRHIWEQGARLRAAIERLAEDVTFDVNLIGNPPRSGLTFGSAGEASYELRGIFLQEAHKRGVLFGGPIFLTYGHSDDDIDVTISVIEAAFARMEEAHLSGDYAAHLEGVAPGTVFRSHG